MPNPRMYDLKLDDDGSSPTNMISMQDVEDYTNDYYENQPGDAISRSSTRRPPRSGKSWTVLVLLTFGTLTIVGGIGFVLSGGKQDGETALSSSSSSSSNTRTPVAVTNPTRPPAMEIGSTPTMDTTGPTHSSLSGLISSLMGSEALLDSSSLASNALAWLEGNSDLGRFSDEQLAQRFTLACLHLSTNKDSTWVNDNLWMSDADECEWHGVECRDHQLIALNMTDNGLEGLIPWEIILVKDTLLALELAGNDLVNQDEELAWMGELTKLRMLDVEETYFAYDGIPPYIARLTDLQVLDVAATLFLGELDGSIFAPLTELLYLEIGGNMYNSSLPAELVNLPKLEALYAYDSGLDGSVEFLSSMTHIFEVWLDDNPNLAGTLPTEMGLLTKMASLSVTNCNLRGQIPTEIGKLMQMEQMWFFGNWFSGVVPAEFAALPLLQILGLEDNNITDTAMPAEICAMGLLALSADCGGDTDFLDCSCCDCCEAPCPVASLPIYEHTRKLEVIEEIRRG